MDKSAEIPQKIKENNVIDVSKLESLAVPVETKPVDIDVDTASKKQPDDREFKELMLERHKESEEKKKSQNQTVLKKPPMKEAYEEVSEHDKNIFLSKLSKVFEKNKNATFPKKNPRNQKEMPKSDRDLVKNYASLKATLEKIKTPIRSNRMLRRSIEVNKIPFSPFFVIFLTAKDENERKKAEGTKFKSRDKFAAVLDILTTDDVIKTKILDFTSLMKNENKQNNLFLFSIIMDPKYDERLAQALNGNYSVPLQVDRTDGGKRRTKKIKIKSKKTRSIKRSKKNITRRR